MITLKEVRGNKDILELVNAANRALEVIGYTEHGPRHVGVVSDMASGILRQLGYDERTVELAAIAGWLHDVGNAVNRLNHGITGAAMLLPILRDMGMPMAEISVIIGAVGCHEEQIGTPLGAVSSALIIADKMDAHKTRVRRGQYDYKDIHDRVNYSIRQNRFFVNKEEGIIRYELLMDGTSSIMDFLEIYMSRMRMCEKAAHFLGCRFDIFINDVRINTIPIPPQDAKNWRVGP